MLVYPCSFGRSASLRASLRQRGIGSHSNLFGTTEVVP